MRTVNPHERDSLMCACGLVDDCRVVVEAEFGWSYRCASGLVSVPKDAIRILRKSQPGG